MRYNIEIDIDNAINVTIIMNRVFLEIEESEEISFIKVSIMYLENIIIKIL